MPDASVDSRARPDPGRRVRPDWLSKTLAGSLLGFSLANIASGVLMTQLHDIPLAVSGQLAMWLVPPVWLLALSLVYFFSSGLRAWAWLLGANAAALGLWWFLQRSVA
jgi:hypothetical protein